MTPPVTELRAAAKVDRNRSGTDGVGPAVVRAVIWLPGLAVAIGAAVATAHGLFEVAVAARVPAGIAWLYPLITDGLALVAYAATARLTRGAARYAWSVVVLAAGLSGLAQAAYLAGGATVDASPSLRFGVGAWPAVAAAVVAHLLYLLATPITETTADTPAATAGDTAAGRTAEAQPGETSSTAEERVTAPARPPGADRITPRGDQREDTERDDDSAPTFAEPTAGAVQPGVQPGVQPDLFTPSGVQPVLYNALTAELADPDTTADEPADPAGLNTPDEHLNGAVEHPAALVEHPPGEAADSAPRDRARAAAARHAAHHGALPTVSELEALAAVSRGTAAAALKALRRQPTPLHVVPDTPDPEPQP